jgi:predicted MFS family arabinose efflux permease
MSQFPSSASAMPAPALSRGLTLVMAVACGVAIANIYYCQPMLGILSTDFHGSALVGLVPTATQLGYALGLFLLVPLGDLRDRRRIIVTQFAGLGLALLLAALAPTAAILAGASLLVGAGATVAQQIVPLAAAMAGPDRRGATIGTVMSGLLCGILLSRTVAGFVGTAAGWRMMFWLAVPLAAAGALAMRLALPASTARDPIPYGQALRSLAHLWREEPTLRRAALTQAGLFGAFIAFWTSLALHLQTLTMGAEVAGMFGVIGAVGVVAAPLAGRLADRRGPQVVITLGAGLTLAAFAVFAAAPGLIGLIVGVTLLDFGVQSAMVSHQHIVYGLRPEARNRLNTLFMTVMFLGGSAGSAGSTAAWAWGGWLAVSALGAALAAAALALRAGAHRAAGSASR